MGFANTLTFAFMHHPYLVCILFGMPFLHLFTFLMFFIFFMKSKEGNRKRPGGSYPIVLSLDGKSGNDNQQRVPVQYLICFSDQLPCT